METLTEVQSQHVRREGGVESDTAAPDISVAPRQRQRLSKHLRSYRKAWTSTTCAAARAAHIGGSSADAALSPTFIGFLTREWLLVILNSNSLHLLVQCITLSLCLAVSARFCSHFSSLLFYCVRRHYAIQPVWIHPVSSSVAANIYRVACALWRAKATFDCDQM